MSKTRLERRQEWLERIYISAICALMVGLVCFGMALHRALEMAAW